MTDPINIYYCKSRKKTGKPIVIKIDGKEEMYCRGITLKNVDITMSYNNAKGKAKRSGATTVLEVRPHKETDVENLMQK